MGLVQYKRNADALNKARQDDVENASGNGVYALTFKNGTTTIRVMPAWSDAGVWYQPITEHFIARAKRTVICTEDIFGRCPVCEHGAALQANGDVDGAKNFRPSTKFLVNAIVLSEPNGKLTIKDGIKMFKLPASVKSELLKYDADTDGDGWGDITDYFHGVNVKVERNGAGLNTKYSVTPLPVRVDIVKKLQEEGIDPNSLELNVLDAIFSPESYETVAAEFNALMGEAPTAEAQPVTASTEGFKPPMATGMAVGVGLRDPVQSALAGVSGFKPATTVPKLNVTIAPPSGLPKRG
jgi:hypothetical protein